MHQVPQSSDLLQKATILVKVLCYFQTPRSLLAYSAELENKQN